jgi:hypothetical protein
MKIETKEKLSRRAFLRAGGASAALLPLLHAEPAAAVGPTGAPKRFVSLAIPNGLVQEALYPPGDALVLGPILKPLEPWKAKVLIPAGLDAKCMLDVGKRYGGHGTFRSLLTGTAEAAGPSLDYVLATEIGQRVRLPLAQLHVAARPGTTSTSWRPGGVKNVAETDPYRLFDRVFRSRALTPERLQALRARRASVLDYLNGEVTAFGARLGAEDRAKIDAHQEAVRALERQLEAPSGACAPTAPGARVDLANLANFPLHVKMQMDLIALAVRCDLTRVVTFDLGDNYGGAPSALPWVTPGGYHGIAHAGRPQLPAKIKIDTWWFQQVAYLVKLLAESPEPGGSALDNSVVLAMGDMNEGWNHQVTRLPFVMIGSCGGSFKTGRNVRLGTWAGKPGAYWAQDSGVPHNRLLASIATAMDVPRSGFGLAAYAGTLPQLSG